MSTDVVEAVVRVHGGVKFYRGAAKAARAYVERDRSRADDYYLAEGSGVATRLTATPDGVARQPGRWTARPTSSGSPGSTSTPDDKKGRVREDANALRFVEVTVNGPKTWSLAAALHPEISAALDEAQDKAAAEIVGWVAQHATTRVGPRGRQVQVPVEQIEAAVIRHYTSRAGDPHRHLHLQINARVWAAGAWRGMHSVGVRDMHRGDQRHRARRGRDRPGVPGGPRRTRAHPGRRRPARSSSSRRTSGRSAPGPRRSAATSTGYEADWRREHPGEEPGPRLREAWDRRAWADARPDKVVPTDGARAGGPLERRAARPRATATRPPSRAAEATRPGWIDRDGAADWSISSSGRSGRRGTPPTSAGRSRSCSPRPTWSPTPPRGSSSPRTSPPAPPHAVFGCSTSADVPEHVRSLTSPAGAGGRGGPRRTVSPAARAASPPGESGCRARADRGSTPPKPPSSAPWRVTASWWSSRARPVPARPPRCGRRRTCWHGRDIG